MSQITEGYRQPLSLCAFPMQGPHFVWTPLCIEFLSLATKKVSGIDHFSGTKILFRCERLI